MSITWDHTSESIIKHHWFFIDDKKPWRYMISTASHSSSWDEGWSRKEDAFQGSAHSFRCLIFTLLKKERLKCFWWHAEKNASQEILDLDEMQQQEMEREINQSKTTSAKGKWKDDFIPDAGLGFHLWPARSYIRCHAEILEANAESSP